MLKGAQFYIVEVITIGAIPEFGLKLLLKLGNLLKVFADERFIRLCVGEGIIGKEGGSVRHI
jgi:hypothetical protein